MWGGWGGSFDPRTRPFHTPLSPPQQTPPPPPPPPPPPVSRFGSQPGPDSVRRCSIKHCPSRAGPLTSSASQQTTPQGSLRYGSRHQPPRAPLRIRRAEGVVVAAAVVVPVTAAPPPPPPPPTPPPARPLGCACCSPAHRVAPAAAASTGTHGAARPVEVVASRVVRAARDSWWSVTSRVLMWGIFSEMGASNCGCYPPRHLHRRR